MKKDPEWQRRSTNNATVRSFAWTQQQQVFFFFTQVQGPVILFSGELWSILVVRPAHSADLRSRLRHVSSAPECCLQHGVFPGGHPSRYQPRWTVLDFGDLTGTGISPPLGRRLACQWKRRWTLHEEKNNLKGEHSCSEVCIWHRAVVRRRKVVCRTIKPSRLYLCDLHRFGMGYPVLPGPLPRIDPLVKDTVFSKCKQLCAGFLLVQRPLVQQQREKFEKSYGRPPKRSNFSNFFALWWARRKLGALEKNSWTSDTFNKTSRNYWQYCSNHFCSCIEIPFPNIHYIPAGFLCPNIVRLYAHEKDNRRKQRENIWLKGVQPKAKKLWRLKQLLDQLWLTARRNAERRSDRDAYDQHGDDAWEWTAMVHSGVPRNWIGKQKRTLWKYTVESCLLR